MSRYISVGWMTERASVNLLTIPDDYSKPDRWSDELLASARGEINYKLMDPRISPKLAEILEKLRQEIEVEMRKRLNVKESPEEYIRRCLFHASETNYTTGDRETRDFHVARYARKVA